MGYRGYGAHGAYRDTGGMGYKGYGQWGTGVLCTMGNGAQGVMGYKGYGPHG